MRINPHHVPGTQPLDLAVTRRRFLQSSALISGWGLLGCAAGSDTGPTTPLRFAIVRPEDRLSLSVEARGFSIHHGFHDYLVPAAPRHECLLLYTFPPQHFAETTIPIQEVTSCGKEHFEQALNAVTLFPSGQSKLVFRPSEAIDKIELSIGALLDWSNLEPVYPDMGTVVDDAGHPFYAGVDWSQVAETTVEMPWGIYLQPLVDPTSNFQWRHSIEPKKRGTFVELWMTLLEPNFGRRFPMPFEVLDVRGLHWNRFEPNPPRVYFDDSDEYVDLKGQGIERSPITNWDRLEIVGSLSRRFPYSQNVDDDLVELDYSGPKPEPPEGQGDWCPIKSHACYVDGRHLEIGTYGLSSFGGWLALKSGWDPKPGCALQAWTHNASFGRDSDVEVERKGWLFPLGVPATLLIISERLFQRDITQNFVAPLVKQAFIRIAQPNELRFNHIETPFAAVSIITESAGPLDPPRPRGGDTTADVSQLAQYDYFLPKVAGQAAVFEIVCEDHNGQKVRTRMPLYFVSNKALRKDGLIAEPGYGPKAAPCIPIPPNSQASEPCAAIQYNEDVGDFSAVTDGGGGLWDLDVRWQQEPYRFSPFDGVRTAIAPEPAGGGTSNELSWVEWVRGEQPLPVDGVASAPFVGRTRLLKLSMPGMQHFSGQRSYVLATYRNLQLSSFPYLDIAPTDHERYRANLFNPSSADNSAQIYLQILPLPGRGDDGQEALPKEAIDRATERNHASRLQLIRTIYFGEAGQDLPLSLFTDLDNEVRFGFDSNTEALGGLAAPDSPIALASARFGPLGDNTFDVASKGEPGHQIPEGRLDYIAYRLEHRLHNALSPFDQAQPIPHEESVARALSYFSNLSLEEQQAHRDSGTLPQIPAIGSLASMFGMDAEILPGIRFSKILAGTSIDLGQSPTVMHTATSTSDKSAGPLRWTFQITGIQGLMNLIGDGPQQITLQDLQAMVTNAPRVDEATQPVQFGIEAGLSWRTASLNPIDLGIIKFKANARDRVSSFAVAARARLDLVSKRPAIDATAELQDFTISVLESIDIEFLSVLFRIDASGRKQFVPRVGEVSFAKTLGFINNLKRMLSDLEDTLGIKIEVSPTRAQISQDIAIPPSAPGQPAGTFSIGPALIENLYFRWGVTIPLFGRTPMSVFFGLASRAEPFVITVPPHGGKAYALIEATTQGIRLFEISVEYGGMLKVVYSVARGEVSLTAGIFFCFRKVSSDDEEFELAAFSKLTGTLDVARVITFSGLIHVVMTAKSGSEGREISGTVSVKVSVKIGLIRYSYSFTAQHSEKRREDNDRTMFLSDSSGVAIARRPTLITDDEALLDSVADSEPLLSDVPNSAAFIPFRKVTRDQWSNFISAYAY